MKVSMQGVPINRTNQDKYISIYRKNKNTVTFEGRLNNIKMSSSEYEMYVDLFLRNEDLIQYANIRPENEEFIDKAFIKDENFLERDPLFIEHPDNNSSSSSISFTQ